MAITGADELVLLDMSLVLQAAELVLAHAALSLQWIGYLSSTSVYGDWGGSWVDERSGCFPAQPFPFASNACKTCDTLLHISHLELIWQMGTLSVGCVVVSIWSCCIALWLAMLLQLVPSV